MQMLHVFHEIHDGGLGARVQGQDGIDNVLRGVVQGHIAVQNLRRTAVFRAPQQVVSGHIEKFRQSAQGIQIRGMDAVLLIRDGPHGQIQASGHFLVAQAFFLSQIRQCVTDFPHGSLSSSLCPMILQVQTLF